MAKRKSLPQSDDDDEDHKQSSSEEEEEEKRPLAKKPKAYAVRRESSSKSAKSTPKTKTKTTSKPQRRSSDSADDGDGVTVLTTNDGDQYVDLGKKKRATVRSFKGNTFVDIREFFGEEGDQKPGKKGISLSYDQWQNLKKSAGAIDRLFGE
ncbi:hypothetical protein JAAARDRAFT_96238, partial [Jaapia argillacea MUCL 33604]